MLKSTNLSTDEVYDNTDLWIKKVDTSEYANAFKNNGNK